MTNITRFFAFSFIATSLLACTGAQSEGSTPISNDRELLAKADGGASGNGTTCSFAGVGDIAVSTTDGKTTQVVPIDQKSYAVGDSFPSPDGCNECTCTAQGIACTEKACAPSSVPGSGGTVACPALARVCDDGSTATSGPNCSQICPEDGTSVGGGADPVACADDAKQCPDGSFVGRSGPSCEFVCP